MSEQGRIERAARDLAKLELARSRQKEAAELRRRDVESAKVNRRVARIVGNGRQDCQLKVLEYVRDGLREGKPLDLIRKELGIRYRQDPRWARISKSLRNSVLNDERVSEYLKKVDDATAVLWGQFERVRAEYERRSEMDEEEMEKEIGERDVMRCFPVREKLAMNKSMKELYDSIAGRNLEIVQFGVEIGSIEKDEKVGDRQQPVVIINNNMPRPVLEDAGAIETEVVRGATIQRYRIGDLNEGEGVVGEGEGTGSEEDVDPDVGEQDEGGEVVGGDEEDSV